MQLKAAATGAGPLGVGDPTGTSTLTVTGAGSTLNALSSLVVGDTSCGCGPLIGTLTVADGGVVNSPGFTGIAQGSTLNLGAGALAGAIVTPAIDNLGQIVAKFTDTLTLSAVIFDTGSLARRGPDADPDRTTTPMAAAPPSPAGSSISIPANSFGTGPVTIDGGGLQWATGNSADISSQLAAFGAGERRSTPTEHNVTLLCPWSPASWLAN